MQLLLVLLSAITPVLVALWYINRKDSLQPEPTKWLIKAFLFGILSAILSFGFSVPTSMLLGMELDANTYSSIPEAFSDAFALAAIPEELAKFIMLWLLLRKNPYFDEHFDGIVYAVCVGMGFAGIENVLYLVQGIEDGSWVRAGIGRALFSIPGHFLFAVLMGYYYSLYHFGIDRSAKAMGMILAAPILAHGIFDGILFSMQINESLSSLCMILFLVFFHKLKERGKQRIDSLMNK